MKKLFRVCIGIAAGIAVHCASAHLPDQPQHQIAELGALKLEKGGVIENLRMSYVTHGKLNAAKSNAILVIHGVAANHHVLDHMIGPGKALDTDKYFVICPDSLGATQTGYEHSTSPSNSGLKMKFPAYNIRDMNLAMHKLVKEKLGIGRLRMVTGTSYGGTQSLQFAVTHPEFVDGVVPIAGGALWSSQSALLGSVTSIIESCDGWKGGEYDVNPKACAANALLSLAPFLYSRTWWEQYIDSPEAYDRWRKNWGEFYFDVQDARDLYYRWRAAYAAWLGDTPGFKDLNAALASIKAKTLFIYSPHDGFYTPQQVLNQVKLIPGAKSLAIESPAGHLICCHGDPNATQTIERAIKDFLSKLDTGQKVVK